jgi:hypothetical protein
MKSEPSSATQKETGSWTSGSWAKTAQESGATGVMEGAAGGGVAAAPEAVVVPVPVPDGASEGMGDWAMSAAASSGRAGSGGMLLLGRKV